MTVTKDFVCLANSRKPGGRCVAGIEISQGKPMGWIRPVSEGGLSEWDCCYQDGTHLDVCDVVAASFVCARPNGYQRENWLLRAPLAWRWLGRLEWSDLATLADPVEPLWIDDFHTRSGQHDRIPTRMAEGLRNSLRLVHVDWLKLRVSQPGKEYGNAKKKLQAGFVHAGKYYWLSVTDPVYERDFLVLEDGEYPLKESYLTISIGEPYKDGFCYKLVAAIIEREGKGLG